MKTIETVFSELQQKKEKALIVSLLVNDPSPDASIELAVAAAQSGGDILELAIPFADATVGGAVIQDAIKRALVHPIDMEGVLAIVSQIAKRVDIPLVLSAYYNPVFAFGEERFCAMAADAGACGLFVVDLPFGERSAIAGYAPQIFPKIEAFASTTPKERLQKIAASASGFLNFIPQGADIKTIAEKVQQAKQYGSLPVCVDAGGREKEEIKAIADSCDGVMLSTDCIACIGENLSQKELVPRLGTMVAAYKQLIEG